MIGGSYGLSTTKGSLREATRLYWLNNACIEFPEALLNKLDKHYASNGKAGDLAKEKIIYTYKDNSTKEYSLEELMFLADLTNGMGNWMGSPSRLDALYKVIGNSEAGLDTKGSTLDFAGRYSISGTNSTEDLYNTPLEDGEKKSILRQTMGKDRVTVTKTPVNISRYVDNLGALELDEAQRADFMTIGGMYGIPKEILDASLEGSTYENQEKAIGRHVGYAIQPKAEDLANGLEQFFGLSGEDLELRITYDHLPFTQVFEKDRADVAKINAETLKTLIEAGATPESAAEAIGMELDFNTPSNEND